MRELVFCKLGGSIITDKRRAETPRPDTIARLADEIAGARKARPDLSLLLGHGSGSFGHYAAERYALRDGIPRGGDWWGYAETGATAARLNRLTIDALLAARVPAVSVQPSASAHCEGGTLVSMDCAPIERALEVGLVPVVYGDVAFDREQGCTIVSTEAVFAYLAAQLRPRRIVLVGEVDGVYDRDPTAGAGARRFDLITPASYPEAEALLGGSHGVDVTGGMLSKVREMVRLVERGHTSRVHVISGQVPGRLRRTLLDEDAPGGTIVAPA